MIFYKLLFYRRGSWGIEKGCVNLELYRVFIEESVIRVLEGILEIVEICVSWDF